MFGRMISARTWRRPAVRRSAWVMASQCASSLTSLLVTVAVARSVGAEEFGVFALGFLGQTTALALTRAVVMQPLAIRFTLRRDDQPGAVRACASAALVIGAIAGVIVAGIGVRIGGDAMRVLTVIGVCLPGMMLQDLCRFAAFTRGVPAKAAVNDLVWLVAQLVVTGILMSRDPGAAELTAAWAGAGCVAAIYGVVQMSAFPGRGALAFVLRHRDLGGAFATEFLMLRGVTYLVVVCLVPLVGVAAAGGLRAVMTLYGPYTTMAFGAASAALSEGSRLLARRPDRFVSTQRLVGVGLALCASFWGVALLVMPSSWGRAALGDSWTYAAPLILPVTATQVARGLAAGSLMGLRVASAAAAIIRLRVVVSVATLAFGLLGALRGVGAAAWGIAVATGLLAGLAWLALGRLQVVDEPAAARPSSRSLLG